MEDGTELVLMKMMASKRSVLLLVDVMEVIRKFHYSSVLEILKVINNFHLNLAKMKFEQH